MDASIGDPFALRRFVEAQRDDFEIALAELRAGAKRSHWIWYVFPQVAGLGSSTMAQRYAIRSRAEAVAYLSHPVLGSRLRECVQALRDVTDRTAREIMGSPDDAKLKSSLTLFEAVAAAGEEAIFAAALDHYFSGERDPRTLEFLATHP